jgi:hypothetical protein
MLHPSAILAGSMNQKILNHEIPWQILQLSQSGQLQLRLSLPCQYLKAYDAVHVLIAHHVVYYRAALSTAVRLFPCAWNHYRDAVGSVKY